MRVQDTLYVPRGFRSPDLVIIPRERTWERLDVALLTIEVSRTSRARDEAKVIDYAQAGVPEYWRIDVEDAEVVVRRKPEGDGYRELRRVGRGETLTPLLGAPEVKVAALLDPA